MSEFTPDELDAVLRSDFCSFATRCFAELDPATEFKMAGYIEVMASRLTEVRDGTTRRLIINVPPRHLKSVMGSVAFPAWVLGHNPSAQIMCVSYAQDLSEKLARDCRAIMMSPWYQELFPNTRLASAKPSAQELTTTLGGVRLASSVGGVLTGRGANLIIIDDALKPTDALSDTLRQGANDWFDNTLCSRLNDKRTGAIVLIMQRLHEDDLVGHVLQQEHWDQLCFPAIAERDEEYEYETVFGQKRYCRHRGEALHLEREPLEILEQVRRTMGEYNFAGQYQQAPAPRGGGLVKAAWFRRYTPSEKPETFDRIVQSWDTANKATELSDYSVCTTWGIKGNDLYLLHVLRKQLEYPDLKREVRLQYAVFLANVILIENKASGTQLIQELIREGLHAVTRYKPEDNKIMRMHFQTATIENGFVYLPTEALWLADYLHEMTVFPNGRYDDQVDSTSQFLDWFKVPRMESWGMFELARMQYEKMMGISTEPNYAPGSVEWQAMQERKKDAGGA
jgi:predicted phage terminase large subunit-like protein